MSRAKLKAVRPDENPHMTGHGVFDLVHNIRARPPEEGHLYFRKEDYSADQLQAIKLQAASLRECTLHNLRSLGGIVAVATASGEADNDDLMNAGYLIQFLAEFAEFCERTEANASYPG